MNDFPYPKLLSTLSKHKDIQSIEFINYGWSEDEKYILHYPSGYKEVLRISSADKCENKAKEFSFMKKLEGLGFLLSDPLAFGNCEEEEKTYILVRYIEGEMLESILNRLDPSEQYRLGKESGTILRKIHQVPLDARDIPTQNKKEKKLRQLTAFEASSIRVPEEKKVLAFARSMIDAICTRESSYLHGDFHPGNVIYTPDKKLGVIDFNRWEIGDPYAEFSPLEFFGLDVSVPYCLGQIHAYFEEEKEVPTEFWEAFAFYVAHASLRSITWAEQFGKSQVDSFIERYIRCYENFDGYTKLIPKWYEESFDL